MQIFVIDFQLVTIPCYYGVLQLNLWLVNGTLSKRKVRYNQLMMDGQQIDYSIG